MTSGPSLAEQIKSAPPVVDPDAAQDTRKLIEANCPGLPKKARDFASAVASCSPYLRRLMLLDPERLTAVMSTPPERSLERAIDRANTAVAENDKTGQMQQLRRAKAEAALTIALADIAGVWDVMTAAAALSRFADAAIAGALDAAIKNASLESAAGLVVLAMGKLGAGELNYSSDIDLIVLFDGQKLGFDTNAEAAPHAVKATRACVDLLHAQTADGYVFRTDLRLRPDPGVSAVALPVAAAETYYEAYGQNWERMAFIKARACAGDIDLGEAFLSSLRPFIWRKYLDFAAIEDVHAVKRQIHSAHGGGVIEFKGHDVKLGRGGIREIEFYVQTQQLILGGKNPALRARATLEALKALRKAGHITKASCENMSSAYRYLRHIEHRLQMINDEQTHRTPRQDEDVKRLAALAGEASAGELQRMLINHLQHVQSTYDALFEIGDAPPAEIGALVFTGVEDHPATLETLGELGFKRGPEISAAIRRWHKGRLRATRTERARGLLTKLMPSLLEALSKAGDPDDAFFAFERFISQLPSGVQVFSLLLNNLEIFDALIRIITISPYLGRELSRRHNFIERLLQNDWAAAPPALASYDDPSLLCGSYEETLNALRRWAGEQKFQIAAQLGVGLLDPDTAARHFSAIADAAIRTITPAAIKEMQRQHGRLKGELAVVGLGRLGAAEMTASSDIDIMFVYDAPSDVVSDGARPLEPVDYYTRLVRRIVTGLSTATEEGGLYEVDMQLRPSGRSGPAAVSLSAFRRYYEKDAWLWEVMALTRARVITSGHCADEVTKEIDRILRRRRARTEVASAVADMRARLLQARPGAGPWDVKHVRGGLTDIAFVCQFLALTNADRLGVPPRHTGRALAWFAANGELAQEKRAVLERAHSVQEGLLQAGRAATAGVFNPETAGDALRQRMAGLCGEDNIRDAERFLLKLQSDVAVVFKDVIGQSG